MRTALILTCLLVPLVPGCGDSAQRIALLEGAIRTGQAQIAADQQVISDLKTQWVAVRTQWADPNQSPPALQALAAKMQALEGQIAAKVGTVQLLEKNIEAYRAELEARLQAGVNLGDEVSLYGKGMTAVAPAVPQPVGIWLGAAGTLLTAIGTGIGAAIRGRIAKSQAAAQQQKTERAVGGLVTSVGALLDVLPTPEQAAQVVKDGGGLLGLPIIDQEAAKSILAREQVKVPEAAAAVRAALGKAS